MTDNNQIFVKDFVEILDIAGIPIAEMGWDYILTLITNRYFDLAEAAKKRGHLVTYKDYLHTATQICVEMDRRGLR